MNNSTDKVLVSHRHRVVVIAIMIVGATLAMSASGEQFTLVIGATTAKPADAPAEKAEDKQRDTPPAAEAQQPGDKEAPAKPSADEKSKDQPEEQTAKDVGGSVKQGKPESKPRPAHRANMDVVWNAVPAVNNQIVVERQIRARLEPMLKVELSFAIRTSEANDEERRAVIAGSKKWLDEFVVDYAKTQDPNQRQMWLQGLQVIGGPQSGDDPRDLVQRGVAKVAADTLPKEKVAAYKTECDKRSAFYRDVTVGNLVDLIDAKVILSPEQRQKISASLKEHWDPSWAPQLDLFAMNNDIWPNVPDQWISPELTAAQRNVLNKANRINGQMVIGGGGFGLEAGEIDDINLDDAPAQASATKAN
jgi:hypothetical protein